MDGFSDPKAGEKRPFAHSPQAIGGVAEDGASQPHENTTSCGSCLTCATDSGIFAIAVVTKR
jgi:hypothetical protein